jgi:hypothetical protein
MVVGVVEVTKDLDMNISRLIAATSIAFLAALPLALAATNLLTGGTKISYLMD